MGIRDLLLLVGLHQFLEDTMVLHMQLVGLSGLQVLLAVMQLLEVSSLRVVLVTGGDGRSTVFDLLHLLQVELEGTLFHVDVGQFGPSLRVEHGRDGKVINITKGAAIWEGVRWKVIMYDMDT
jgi:hypothetical protein